MDAADESDEDMDKCRGFYGIGVGLNMTRVMKTWMNDMIRQGVLYIQRTGFEYSVVCQHFLLSTSA